MATELLCRACQQLADGWQISDFRLSSKHLLLTRSMRLAASTTSDWLAPLAAPGDFQALAYCLHPSYLVVVDLPTEDLELARELAPHYLPASASLPRLHLRRAREAVQAYHYPPGQLEALRAVAREQDLRLLGVSEVGSALLQLQVDAASYYYYQHGLLLSVDRADGWLQIDTPEDAQRARALLTTYGTTEVHLGAQLVEQSRGWHPPSSWDAEQEYHQHLLNFALLQPLLR